MLTSYLRSAVRGLLRDSASTLINAVGLSVALASAVVVFLFLQVYYTLDAFHENAPRIVMVEHVVGRGGAEQTWGTAPLALGPALETDLPQVERAVRVAWVGGDVRTAEATFEERIGFADPGFFDIFTFPLQAGAPGALAEPGAAVLSATAARAYFGDAEPVGQRLTVSVGDARARAVTVAAVAAPFPNNAGLRFDILLPFDARPVETAPAAEWSEEVDATFLLLRRPHDAAALASALERYLPRANEARPDDPVRRFVVEPLARPAPDAYTVLRRPTEAPHPAFALILAGLAAFMVALSCVNYVNTALGSADRRRREIGVRKALGATRGQVAAQFLTENALLCGVALVLGLGVAQAFLIPLFNGLFVTQIGLSLTSSLGLWAFLAGLLVVVSAVSGSYPALYLASLRPVRIATTQRAAPRGLSLGLMAGQLVVACLGVTATVLLLLHGRYLAEQAWGYDPGGVVVVQLSDPAQLGLLRDAALGQSGVLRVAGTPDHIGSTLGRVPFSLAGEARDAPPEHEARVLDVGPGYAEAVGLRLARGRLLDERLASDTASVVVNERFAQEAGWADGVGQTVRLGGDDVTVVGVVHDFLYDPLVQAQPLALRRSGAPPRFLVARVLPGREAAVEAALAGVWTRLVPDLPFEAFPQSEVFDAQLGAYANLARSVGVLAALALLIACMGVFGIASQNVARRRKEASVRKVLGASVAQLVVLVNRGVVALLTLAALVATAACVGGLVALGSLRAVNLAPTTPTPFVAAYLLVLLAVGLSVASQTRALVLANPADVLRGD